MTQTTLDPIAIAQPDPCDAFEAMRQAAKVIATAPISERGTWLMVLFEAMRREGLDVLDLVPCALSEVVE